MNEYEAIVIGSTSFDFNGRPLGPYRLRTSARNSGYDVKVIDFGYALDADQMLTLLKTLTTKKTIILGLSSAWMDTDIESANPWLTEYFFKQVRLLFPWISIVLGGTKNLSLPVAYKNADWYFTGFSDISFVKLLDKITGKSDDLKYSLNLNLKKIVHSDVDYIVQDMDTIETVLEKEDDFKSYQPVTLELSRGCIFKCVFCTHPFLGKKSYEYIRSSESIARELARNYELFGTTRYMLADDTFNDSIEKLDRLEKAIKISGIPKFEFTSYIRGELLATKSEMIPRLKDLGIKGYHIGLESMGKEARKIIGKGMDYERVFEAVSKLNAISGARAFATLIVGLPGDKPDDYYKWQEILEKESTHLFREWSYFSLGIGKPQDGGAYSMIEKDPKAYGYTLIDNPLKHRYYSWIRDDGLTDTECQKIADELSKKNFQTSRIGGWAVASAWYAGLTDDQIASEKIINLKDGFPFWGSLKIQSIRRAKENYEKITKQPMSLHIYSEWLRSQFR